MKNPSFLVDVLRGYDTAMTGTVTKKYLDQKRWRITEHLGPELSLPIDKIDLGKMEEVRSRYLSGTWKGKGFKESKEGRSIGGWNSLLRDVRSVLGWAVERGLTDAMPFKMRPGNVQAAVKSVIWPE